MRASALGWAVLGLLITTHVRADPYYIFGPLTPHTRYYVLTPTMNTMVAAGTYQNTNFSGSPFLIQSISDSSGPVAHEGLLSFQVPSVAGTIDHAAVYINPVNETNASPTTFYLYRNTSSWQESNVTWNTTPTYDPTPIDLFTTSGILDLDHQLNVTSWLNGVLAGKYPNYGFTLVSSIGGVDQAITFASSYPDPKGGPYGFPGGDVQPIAINPASPELTIQYEATGGDEQPNATPEPTSLALAGIAALGTIGYTWGRRAGWRSA